MGSASFTSTFPSRSVKMKILLVRRSFSSTTIIYVLHGEMTTRRDVSKRLFFKAFEVERKEIQRNVERHSIWTESSSAWRHGETSLKFSVLSLQGPAAIIALKLLEENPKEKDEYRCAFLQSPVTNLSFYRKNRTKSERERR